MTTLNNEKNAEVPELIKQGNAFLEQGECDRAAERFTKVIEIDRLNILAMLGLSRVAVKIDRIDVAEELLEAACKIRPNDKELLAAKESLSSIGQKQSEPEAVLKVPEDAPGLAISRWGDERCAWNCVPSSLDEKSTVYCVGCGENISFDLEVMEKVGCPIYAFDPTPKSLDFLRSLTLPDTYKIYEYGLAHFDGPTQFNPPVNPDHVSHTIAARPETAGRAITVQMRRLSTVMSELGHKKIDLLKMDIEGAEYPVLQEIVQLSLPVDQILVEFHHFLDSWSVEHTFQAIIMLSQAGYVLFAVHGDTDYSFIRRDLLAVRED